MNNVLIEFSCIFDTDFGILETIKQKYRNPKYIDIEYLDKVDKDILLYSLSKREKENPLSLVINEKYIDSMDILLEDFNKNELNNIYKNSQKTNLYNLMIIYLSTKQIKVTVLCKNKIEGEIIKNINKPFNTIIQPKYEDIDLDEFDCIFVKEFKDVLKFKNVRLKHIYICRYYFNLEKNEEKPLKDIFIKIPSNEFHLVDIYDTNLNALG